MGRLGIIVPTHDRPASLRRTLQSVIPQLTPSDDLLVVDNNSGPETSAVCREFAPRIRCIRETRQGLSHARNAGIEALGYVGAGDIIAFIDDDIEAQPGWIDALAHALRTHPEAGCAGGRVLPSAASVLPAWLTREHWAPLALQDHGSHEQVFDERHPAGLVGANFAFRADVFEAVGGFSPAVQRVKDGIGSTEDHEFLRRMYASGRTALYVPGAVVTTEVPPERTSREYHRRWHRGHGRFHALMRLPEVEKTRARFFGVPLHLVRRALADLVAWLRSRISGDRARAFSAETRLWFFTGFLRERCLARR
jgi:glycosyltransferase involved in cell wall biosynthesis